jgi:iron complex outermembrane receptor protein
MQHSLLVGLDVFQSVEYSELYTKSDAGLATDLFNPRPGTMPLSLLTNPDWSSHDSTTERWAGLYVQDQIHLSDSLYVLAGARYDFVEEQVNNLAYDATNPYIPYWIDYGGGANQVHALKARGGLLWHPAGAFSLYANYIQNFGVSPGLYYSTNNQQELTYLPAERASEWEAGLKLETADGKASAAIAFFDLSKENISSPILEPAIDNAQNQFLMHAVTNRGMEADFHGEVLPGLQVLASYAFIDSRIDNDSFWYGPLPKGYELIGSTGNRLAGVPRHGGSLWTTYRVTRGMLHGLKLGFGAVARSAREGDNANDYQLPAFVKCSAVAAYGWRAAGANFTLQLNVDNMFDKRYFESLSGTHTVVPGTPRSWLATVNVAL